MKPLKVTDLEWNLDPAASGNRLRVFHPPFELVAYEDGRYALYRDGKPVVIGETASKKRSRSRWKRAQGVVTLLFNHERSL